MTAALDLSALRATEYELIYILRPDVTHDKSEAVLERIKEVLAKENAKLTRVDVWGRRRMAYRVRGHARGIFVYLRFVGMGNFVAEVERNLRQLEQVMRFQTVAVERNVDLGAVTVNEDEVKLVEVEAAGEEDDNRQFEQRLGLVDMDPRPKASDSHNDDGEQSNEQASDESGSRKEASQADDPPATGDEAAGQQTKKEDGESS